MSDGATPAAVWDGDTLRGALAAATDWLEANRDRVNALNVFPVPDGDTGTNMALTMRAAVEEAARLPEAERGRVGAVGARLSYGALMGARGNSGVILSQVFRGVARAIADLDAMDGRDLARALTGAREMAYKAVMRPVEGTMLTVVRVAAERAEAIAGRSPALPVVLAEALRGAEEALATTPDLLPILRQAGVVDAGGQGLVCILDGMSRFARGEAVPTELPAAPAAVGAEMTFLDRVEELHGEDVFGYCTNFVVFGSGIDVERARADLAAMGKSAVIVGDGSALKVHIHTLNPGHVLDYAVRLGELGQIKIDNMNAQTEALTAERQRAVPVAPRVTPPEAPAGRQAALAVASGEGLADALRSMGATGIIPGGQTMNPSIEELLRAVEAAPADEVILLPNNPNIVLAASQVPELSRKTVRIVPSRSVPQGLAALAAFNAETDLEANVAAMTEALGDVQTIEITCADKDATIDGLAVRRGQLIGLLDDRLVAGGDDELAVARATLAAANLDDAELATVFTGDEATPQAADALRELIETLHPHLTVEVYVGGQPHYRYVVAIE